MKKKIIYLEIILAGLLYPVNVAAQFTVMTNDSAYVSTLDDLPFNEPFDTAHSYRRVKERYLYLISDNDVYQLFGYATMMRYYQFDFDRFHILGEKKCEYCLRTPAHRNACDSIWVWVVRDNKKAFGEVPLIQTRGGRGSQPARATFKKPLYNDTIVCEHPSNDTATWYTSGGGDCFARFQYKLYRDKYRPVLLLKEWNFWGGCRAGGYWDFEITFLLPKGITDYSKRTILAEKKQENSF